MSLPLEVSSGAAWFERWNEAVGPTLRAVVTALRENTSQGYLIGGGVRDLLLSRPTRDLDIVLPHPVTPVAEHLTRTFGGLLTCHDTFLTCSLSLPEGTLDLSQTRREHYTRPGALPRVTPSDLIHDLYRRDFSVNTLALGLDEPHELLGVFGARADLEAGVLRSLHERSFFDDPSRIVRGARLAARLGFTFDTRTASAVQVALKAGAGAWVSPARRKNELLLCLEERAVSPVVGMLSGLGVLDAFYGLEPSPLLTQLDALKATQDVPPESYLLALLLPLSESAATTFVGMLGFPQRLLKARTALLQQKPARTASEAVLTRLLYPESAPPYPPVQGSDVISLGLPAGPRVGLVLRELAQARARGEVASFADELELARRLVRETLQENV